jgi:N-acetyl-alpha-D-muramate 1-phosphate uridylyltransferase
MILAAGRGERMRPLTDHTPKPLLTAGGKTLIAWQIARLAAAGLTDIVINHAHLGEQIEAALGDGRSLGVDIVYSREARALETAGGVVNAMHLLGQEPFAVVSADIYTEYDYTRLAAAAASLASGNRLGHIVLVDNPAFHPRGDFALAGDRVMRDGANRYTYANIAVYLPQFFASVTRGTKAPTLPLWLDAIDAGRLGGEHYGGVWDNIGTPEQLAALDHSLRG